MADADAQLLEAARAGDREALEHLLERYQPRIFRFGMKMCGDVEDAKEVLQDTLIAAVRHLSGFRGASSLSTWLYTIARSVCIKRRRRSRFAPPRECSLDSDAEREAAALADPGRAPDEALAAHESERQLEEAIAGLAPAYREVLVLRDMEGLTAPEVAEVLGIGVDAVKSRLHRARAMVRARLQPKLVREEGAPSPSCPDIIELFSRDLEGEISADLCATMERHLASCTRCRSQCEGMRRVLALCSSAAAPRVPPEVQQAVRRAVLDAGRAQPKSIS